LVQDQQPYSELQTPKTIQVNAGALKPISRFGVGLPKGNHPPPTPLPAGCTIGAILRYGGK
jgi:hypothetical protein